MTLNQFTHKAVFRIQSYFQDLIPKEFVVADYEILPLQNKNMYNFIVTARHVNNERLMLSLSLSILKDDLKKVIDKGMKEIYPTTTINSKLKHNLNKGN